jgi:hypothetical protein
MRVKIEIRVWDWQSAWDVGSRILERKEFQRGALKSPLQFPLGS